MARNVVDLRKKRPGASTRFIPLPLPPSRRKQRTPLRARRRRMQLIIILSAIVAVILCIGAVSYVSYLQRFNIQTITVSGVVHADPAKIESFARALLHDGTRHFISRSNIFFYHPKEIEKEIVAQFPRVKSASVRRDALLSTTMIVAVTERQPYALWCKEIAPLPSSASSTPPARSCFLMDDGGFIFAASGGEPPAMNYVFGGGLDENIQPIGRSFASSHLPGILALLELLKRNDIAPLGATVVGDEDFFVPLSAGYYLKASFGESAEDLVKNLQLVLTSDALNGKQDQIEYIDLRFGDRVYYKIKGQSESQGH